MTRAYYNLDTLNKMGEKFAELREAYQNLSADYLSATYSTDRGKEFAHQGFLRRCNLMWRCLENTFSLLPPDLEGLPEDDATKDASIQIQCFVIHVFGSCDDLAWMIVMEKDIRQDDGRELPRNWVGLRRTNRSVRAKISEATNSILDGFDDWFNHVEEFRHSLAHRIPLYVPPFTVRGEDEQTYTSLENEKWAAIQQADLGYLEQIEAEQNELKHFRPWYTQSYFEGAEQVAIHPQMLADFATIIEIGKCLISELDN